MRISGRRCTRRRRATKAGHLQIPICRLNAGFTAVGVAFALMLVPPISGAASSCSGAGRHPGWQTVQVRSGGENRELLLYTPASASGRSDVALVFDLHGSGGNGREQALHSGLAAQADSHGFLLANPNGGIAAPDNPTDSFYWHVPGVPLIGGVPMPANAPDDVQFFRDAIEQLEQTACVDPRRIYVTGFSGGARMASALACELSDRIAAIAPVAGLRAGVPGGSDFSTPDMKTCNPQRAVSIMTFHGVHDPTNRFEGDGEPRWGYGVLTALERWRELDGCSKHPSERKVSAHVAKVTYRGCRDASELILYRTDAPVKLGGGHIWPHPGTSPKGSAPTDEQVDQLDASALMWEFFSRH